MSQITYSEAMIQLIPFQERMDVVRKSNIFMWVDYHGHVDQIGVRVHAFPSMEEEPFQFDWTVYLYNHDSRETFCDLVHHLSISVEKAEEFHAKEVKKAELRKQLEELENA